MAAIKPLGLIKDKWTRVTPQRTEDYRLGVENPRRPWEESTAKAEDNWKNGIADAASKGRFAKGVRAAGNSKWQKKTLEKGPRRFAEGVQIAGDDYAKGFAPYRETIEKTKLPPRYPKGDPRNIDRVRMIAQEMRKTRLAM